MKKGIILAILVIVAIFIYIWCKLGFKITYAPELENDWSAIEAVGTWVGVISPLLLAIVNSLFAKDIESTKNEISMSNRKLYESNKSLLDLSDEAIETSIIDYITICINVSTKEIAEYMNKEVSDLIPILNNMQTRNLIHGINNRKGINPDEIIWKIQ